MGDIRYTAGNTLPPLPPHLRRDPETHQIPHWEPEPRDWGAKLGIIILIVVLGLMIYAFNNTAKSAELPTDSATCLANNIYFEAANEPLAGQLAVAQVTVNRAADPAYPDTVCDVVYFKRVNPVTHKKEAAFSWTLGKAWRAHGPVDPIKYAHCMWVAQQFLAGALSAPIGKRVEFYHAVYVHPPAWHYHLVAVIGNHEFFRR